LVHNKKNLQKWLPKTSAGKVRLDIAPMVDVAPRCSLRKIMEGSSGEDPFFRSKLLLPELTAFKEKIYLKILF
jgi:hypothetical protein